MKTITSTFFRSNNYGALLQAYALQRTIISLGHENVILNVQYKPSGKKKKIRSVRDLYFRCLKFIRGEKSVQLTRHFDDFRANRLLFSERYYLSKELEENPPQADCLITGSDQVWNFHTTDFMNSRLLKYGAPDLLRFSYAASIEVMDYDENQKQRMNEALSHFQGISVREESAKEYLKSFTDYDCQRVLDPVFLLQAKQWNQIAKEPRVKGPYILCYQVQSNKKMQKTVNELKKRTGYPIVSICNGLNKWIRSDYTFFDVSIEEFLGLYRDAAVVVSASFHGVAFGLVYEKPVYAMVKKARANRIKEIMGLFGLSDYVISEDSNVSVPNYSSDAIAVMRSKKEMEIEASMSYLKKMLSNAN